MNTPLIDHSSKELWEAVELLKKAQNEIHLMDGDMLLGKNIHSFIQQTETQRKECLESLTESDLQLMITALTEASRAHDNLVQRAGDLMHKEERIRHLEQVSRYNDLSKKIQNI